MIHIQIINFSKKNENENEKFPPGTLCGQRRTDGHTNLKGDKMGFADEIPSDDAGDSKKKSKPKEQVYFADVDAEGMNLFDKVAAYKSAIKIIEGELEIAETDLKSVLRQRFAREGMRTHTKPDSIEAQGEVSSSTISFKKGISVLDKKTQEDFKGLGINFSVVEKVEIKKAILQDSSKVDQLIDLIKDAGLKVSDYFDRTMKVVPSDRTTSDILDSVKDLDKVVGYLEKVSTIAIGTPHFDGDSIKAKEKIVDVLDDTGIFKV